jgi:LysR family transcriptional regulator, cys regulon transcriptional activator
MNFQQLRIIRETARCNFNLTEVASALLTSQSGVSKHVKDLEDELGVELFVRRGKRLLGLTEAGKEAVEIVGRMLLEAENLAQIAGRMSSGDQGILKIATTHTQGRYYGAPYHRQVQKGVPERAPRPAPGEPQGDRLHRFSCLRPEESDRCAHLSPAR